MAWTCPNCKQQASVETLPDGTVKCGNCGSVVSSAPVVIPGAQPPAVQPAKPGMSTASKVILGVLASLAGATLLLVVGVAIAIAAGACPFLYVDRGQGLELAGVPYAGAIYRSVERDDLLPLGALPAGRARLALVNGGKTPEKDYTDRAELWVVDHAPELHAVAGAEGQLLFARGQARPTAAVDLRGRDQLALVSEADGREWQTDLARESQEREPLLREGLEARFAAPTGAPVLELTLSSSPWVEVVFTRWAALFGDKLDEYTERGNRPENRQAILDWHDQEGMDLRVEVLRGGAWQRVADVPTPGLSRQVAVALPALEGEREVRVRVSGAVGFWRIDQLALSSAAPAPAEGVRRLAPAKAVDDHGVDQRPALASADDQYQVLPQPGDRLALEFELPALPTGQVRETFFAARGYYNMSGIAKGMWSPVRLLLLHYREGGLSRLSLQLAREQGSAEALAAVERDLAARQRLPEAAQVTR